MIFMNGIGKRYIFCTLILHSLLLLSVQSDVILSQLRDTYVDMHKKASNVWHEYVRKGIGILLKRIRSQVYDDVSYVLLRMYTNLNIKLDIINSHHTTTTKGFTRRKFFEKSFAGYIISTRTCLTVPFKINFKLDLLLRFDLTFLDFYMDNIGDKSRITIQSFLNKSLSFAFKGQHCIFSISAIS